MIYTIFAALWSDFAHVKLDQSIVIVCALVGDYQYHVLSMKDDIHTWSAMVEIYESLDGIEGHKIRRNV
jgi:hypothetical protein